MGMGNCPRSIHFTFAGSNLPMKQPRGSSFGMGPFQLSSKVAIPLRRMALLIFLPLFPRIIDAKEANNSFSVTVRCSANAMEMFVQFREPFNGRLKVRPDGQCFVNGRGRLNVGFRLPLDERHRKKCSIIRREAEFIALVDLEMNPSLATADDNSYFVRCPILREGDLRGEEREKGNLSARIGPLDAEMRIFAEEGKIMNLSLDTPAGQKAHLRQCIAFSPLAGPDGQLQAIQLGNQNSSCGHFGAGKKFVQFRPPDFEGKTKDGKFFVQCEIAEGGNGETEEEEESACNTNSSSIGPLHRSLASIRLAYPLSNAPSECSPPPPPLEEYLLAILLGVLLALGIASICLIAVHLLGKRRNRRPNRRGMLLMGRGGRKNSKRVQIVCPTVSSSTAPVHYASGLSFAGSSLSFGSSPIQQAALFCCPPPSPPPPLPSLHSPQCPECPSPTSTVTTALALSLDKLPEPPSLSLAEIRQLNLAFNGFMMANGANGKGEEGQKEEGEYLQPPKQQTGRVYSFAGIRLNSQQMEMEQTQKNNDCWINY